jgi:hypothetical protein
MAFQEGNPYESAISSTRSCSSGSGAMWQADFKGLEIDACPFANLPEKKRTQWALQTDCPACATAI